MTDLEADTYDRRRDDSLDFPADDWEQREWDDARYKEGAVTEPEKEHRV